MNNRVRNSWGRVSNLPLLLAEEGSQITTFGGRRVPNFSFLIQNFWREKGLKSQQIGGRRVSNEDFTPPKSCRLIFKIEGPEKNQKFDLNRFAPDKRFLVGNWTKNKNKWVSEPRKISFCPKIALTLDGLSGTRKT